MKTPRATLSGWLMLCALCGSGVSAQSLRAGLGLSFEQYRFGDGSLIGAESVSLIAVPLAAQALVASRGVVDITTAFARATLTGVEGSTATLSGLTDTELRASWPFETGNLTVTVTGALTLPTGHESLTVEELLVAGHLASDLLPFRISNWGTGGGAGFHASVARASELINYGVSASYRRSAEFTPIDGASIDYRPGDEIRIRAAVDRSITGGGKVSVQFTVSTFGDDAWAGQQLYKSGTRLQAVSVYEFPAGAGSANLYAGVLRRSGSALNEDGVFRGAEGLAVSPAQTLIIAGSMLRAAVAGLVAAPSVELRALRSADGVGQGWIAMAGSALELPFGAASSMIVPVVRARIGSLKLAQDRDTSILGLEAGATIRFGSR